jgi:hypothetical protein
VRRRPTSLRAPTVVRAAMRLLQKHTTGRRRRPPHA